MNDAELRTPSGLRVPAAALNWSFSRAGGPGGQHVDTSSSKVSLVVAVSAVLGDEAALARLQTSLPAQVRVTSQSARSQWRNRQECLDRVAVLLDQAAAPPGPPRRRSRPTRGSVERRLAGKRKTSEQKQARRASEW